MIRKKRMSKGIAKILSGLLVFGMVAGLVPAIPGGTVHAKAAEISGQNATTEPHIQHCICGKGEHTKDGHDYKEETWKGINKLSEIDRQGPGSYYLMQDVELESAWTCQRNVNLCLNGHSITRTTEATDDQNGNNAVIIIIKNVDFTLTDCKGTGTITHKQGVSGEGVYNEGRFFMYNGTISGNNGGVKNPGMFFMYGGTITLNTAYNGGGVDNDKGVFSMYGGTITSNKSNMQGGGVDNGKGTFYAYGGTITNNTTSFGGGVYNEGGEINIYDGTTISGNNAKYGVGVCNATGRFNMYGGEIKENKSGTYGGGVYNQSGTFYMSGGIITANISTTYGGGVYNEAGTFNMPGGTITNNESNEGGGVYNAQNTLTSPSTIKMSGQAEISNNQAASAGGGVFASEGNEITLNGAVKITGNTVGEIANNLYIVSPLNLYAKSLTDGAEIGVTACDEPKDDSSVTITSDSTKAEYFISDNGAYETTNDNGQVVLKKRAAVEAPVIITQPQPISVKVGENATFTVNATGTDLKYQWQVNKNDNAEFVNIDGATGESYKFNVASAEFNGYQYQCVVSNQSGSVTSASVILTVTENSTPEPNPNPTPNPEPEPTPTPTPEPSPTPTPNPTPEATTPTPDSAPATTTPAASTTAAPAASAPAQVTYDILDGAGSSWTQNTDGSLAIRGSGEISKFREVKVDGVTVDPVNYTVTEGSTIITFKPEYLKSLSAGNHSFELVWTDGTAATNFTVAENADQSAKSPKTSEDFSMALCTAFLMVSCAGLAGMLVRRKKSCLR